MVNLDIHTTPDGNQLVITLPFDFTMPVGVSVDDCHTAIEHIENVLNDVGVDVLERLVKNETQLNIKITYHS